MKLSRSCTGRWRTLLVSCCAIGAAIGGARAEEQSAPKLPVCDKKIGTLAVVEPKDTTWWHELQLDSPAALIKVYVAESKCFRLVDPARETLFSAAGESS